MFSKQETMGCSPAQVILFVYNLCASTDHSRVFSWHYLAGLANWNTRSFVYNLAEL